MTFTAGLFTGSAIESVPTWYLQKLIGDTTSDGLHFADLGVADQARLQFELICRSDPDWNTAVFRELLDSIVRFCGDETYRATISLNSEEIDMNAADENAAVASAANLLPAVSTLLGVKAEVTEGFTGDVTNYNVGDGTTSNRFILVCTLIKLRDRIVIPMNFNNPDPTTGVNDNDTSKQTSADVVKVLLNDAAVLGKIRVTVLYVTFVAL